MWPQTAGRGWDRKLDAGDSGILLTKTARKRLKTVDDENYWKRLKTVSMDCEFPLKTPRAPSSANWPGKAIPGIMRIWPLRPPAVHGLRLSGILWSQRQSTASARRWKWADKCSWHDVTYRYIYIHIHIYIQYTYIQYTYVIICICMFWCSFIALDWREWSPDPEGPCQDGPNSKQHFDSKQLYFAANDAQIYPIDLFCCVLKETCSFVCGYPIILHIRSKCEKWPI